MASFDDLDFLLDPEFWKSVKHTAPNSLAKASQGLASATLGAPVDIANLALRPIGLGSKKPVLGSEYLSELFGIDTGDTAYQIGSMLPVGPGEIAAGAKALPLAMAGIFAGRGAKTADALKLARAQEMAKAGVPDAQIWKETGWTLDTPDKLPRFEIPDDAAKLNMGNLPLLERGIRGGGGNAPDLVEHPELYNNYPMNDTGMNLTFGPRSPSWGGKYSDNFIEASGENSQKAKSTALHELQHAIQQREGFARGGSPETSGGAGLTKESTMEWAKNAYNKTFHQWLTGDQLLDELTSGAKKWEELTPREQLGWIDQGRMDAYRHLAGEAEARLTQARMAMTPEQRLAQYPYDPAYFEQATGVPLNSLIVRNDVGTAMSVPAKTEFELAHEVAQRNAALPVEQGGLGLPPNNTAMDRAKAMGFDMPAYHGGSTEIDEFNQPVNWFAENPLFASEFSNNKAVYPTILKTDGEFIAPKGEKTLKQWERILTNAGVSLKDAKPVDWAHDYGKYTFFDLFPHAGNNLEMIGDGGMAKAVAEKFSTVASGREIENGVKSGKVTAVFNPSNIRSRFAAFDPMQRNSANILAGGAAGAIGLNALAPYLQETSD